MLFSAQTVSMVAGFFASIIQGRWMEPREMGRFAFCLSIIVVTSLVFEFGISSAGARVLAIARNRESERQALGALILMTIAISVVFSLAIAAAAEPIDLIFDKDVRWLFIATAALAFFQPFQLLVEQSCQGLNQIRRLSVFQLTMAGCYLVGLIVLVVSRRLTAGTALGAYLMGIGVAAAWTLIRMQPSFKSATGFIRLTLKETRGYGFNLYLARISGLASSRSDQLAIGYFIPGTSALGMYAIAQKFSNPIAIMGRSLATTRFRAFARLTRVPARIIRWNSAAVLAASIGLVVLGPFVLRFVFPKYSDAVPLLVPFAVMNLFVGLFQPYNIFLASHGRGAELRNIVFIAGLATIAALVIAVPRFGIAGAAWTGAGAMALDYILHLLYYRRFRRTLEEARVAVEAL
ncbi:MAG TPA: oligosaccharide flippase family protein [Blastocatellia bacterium]|nr:oligosaccharide flippase family protein [Blastocatellia bacterium]